MMGQYLIQGFPFSFWKYLKPKNVQLKVAPEEPMKKKMIDQLAGVKKLRQIKKTNPFNILFR